MLLLAAGIAGVVGLVLLTNGVYFFLKDKRERAAWGSASGVVVGHRERFPPLRTRPRSGTSVFTPIVKFTTEHGQVVEFEHPEGRRPPQHPVGQAVPVIHDRATPQSARIDVGTSWTAAAPFLFGGLIGLLLAAGLVWYRLAAPA